MIITEELREVMEEHQEDTESSTVQPVHRLGKLSISQERREELEERS